MVYLSAVVLLGALCNCGHAAETEAKPPPGKLLHVRVRAVDTQGKPIAGALIEIWQDGGERSSWWTAKRVLLADGKEVRTASDGWAAVSFTMASKRATNRTPESAFCLTAQAKHYLVTRSGAINVAPSDHFEVILTLRRLFVVEGRVVDQHGRPVVEATVFHTGNATPRSEAKTDGQGRFRLEGLPEGQSPVFVTCPGYHFHGQLIDSSAKPQPWELKLLAADQTPPALRTLPPLRSHDEELKIARQVIRPLWEAALKSGDDREKEEYCEMYANVEPWVAYAYVNGHLSKGSKNRFLSWKMPLVYAADPEEALGALESLDTLEYMKAFALLNTVAEAPNLSRQQKLDLLDRAAQHLRATTDVDERVLRLSRVAIRLFELGKAEEAKKIVEIVTPPAKQLSPKTNAAELAAAGEAISHVDLPAGLQLIYAARDAGDEYYWERALFHVVYRVAKRQPAEAERLAVDALESVKRLRIEKSRKDFHRDPTAEEMAGAIAWRESRLIPLCYGLVSTDAAQAERIATAIHNPHWRAYALGMVAKAVVPSDRTKARRLILQAYDILTEACQSPDRRAHQLSWSSSEPTIPAALLPVIEEIDPTLVGECMWRAVSFRLHRPADDLLLALEPERNNAWLAAFVARYDRDLARALLPNVENTVVPVQGRAGYYNRVSALAVIDVNEALEVLRADAASPGGSARESLGAGSGVIRLLSIEGLHRWEFLVSRHDLWIPDNQYVDEHAFDW